MSGQAVTVGFTQEEAEAAKWILGRSPQVEMPVGPETAAQRAWSKLADALSAVPMTYQTKGEK